MSLMNQKRWIKAGIVLIIICVISFSDWSFAADPEGGIKSLSELLNFLVSIVSWLRIIFAKIAGEFLTNRWVYGEVLGIDVLLWQYRNIVKNMANFCLGFYLVYVIFKGLIGQYGGKGDVMKNLRGTLLWVLVAGVLVQASWFLTSVVVDVSTIVLSAVGSLPSQIVSENENLEQAIQSGMKMFGDGGKLYDLFPEDGAANSFTKTVKVSVNRNLSKEEFTDEILPKKDSVSGPLFYMGWSILRTNEINSIDGTNLKKSLINLIIQGGTTIVYSIEIGVLCVLALMRIIYLWMFIVLSPLAILLTCLQKSGEKDLVGKGFVADLMKQINLKTFFLKVFQPSVVVLGISLCLIFVTLVNGVINKDTKKSMEDFDIGGAKITTIMEPKSPESDDVTYTTELHGNMAKISISSIGKGFLDFIMAIITVVLVYLVIQMAVKMGGGDDFVSKGINKIQDSVSNAMTSVPIVPVAGYDELGVPTTRAVSLQGLKNLPQGKIDFMTQEKKSVTNEQVDKIMEQWGLTDKNSLTESQKSGITAAGRGKTGLGILEAKRDYINDAKNEIKSKGGKGMTLNPNASDQYWILEFEKRLTDMKGKAVDIGGEDKDIRRNMITRWNDHENDRTLEKMFKENRSRETASVKAYAKLFGYENISTWIDLINLDLSQTE